MTTPKRPPTPSEKCGTVTGRMRHVYCDEEVCLDCAAAWSRYQRLYRVETGRAKTVPLPLRLAAELATGAEPIAALQEHLGPDMVQALRTYLERGGCGCFTEVSADTSGGGGRG